MSEREHYEHEGSTTRRLDRVESDVSSLTAAVGELRGDVRSFGQILTRIENGLAARDGQQTAERLAGRPNVTAIAAVLVTIITTMITGAWLVSGQLSRLDERDIQRDRQVARIEREAERTQRELFSLKDS